jgi:peroxiredoxin
VVSSRTILTIGLSASLVLAALLLPTTLLAVQVGDQAPGFSLPDLDGGMQSLADQAGSVVLLYFFGHNASACLEPARVLEGEISQAFSDRGLQILGIECWEGNREQVAHFQEEAQVTYPLLLGGRNTATAYDLPYLSFVVIDARGIVQYVSPGPDPASFSPTELEQAIKRSLDDAAAVTNATWGAIKNLYGRGRKIDPTRD